MLKLPLGKKILLFAKILIKQQNIQIITTKNVYDTQHVYDVKVSFTENISIHQNVVMVKRIDDESK